MKKIVLLAFVLVLLPTVLSLFVVGLLELQIAYASPYTSINVGTAYNMITNGSYPDLVVLDVRTQSEYDSGHIYGAVWIPHTELEARIDELAGHENHEIIVYCLSGGRSATASVILDSHNFTKVYNMLGGITAWQSAGYPVYIATVHNVNNTFNYDTIQAAIDAPQTLDGHTILADTGIYYEHVVVNKSISLMGENRSTTIIDGNETGTVVTITARNVSISGFTVQHGGFDRSGIYVSTSSGVTISDNTISNNFEGVHLNSSNGNNIADNIISPYVAVGIFLEYSDGNVINGNRINPGIGLDQIGILLTHSTENIIINNTILNNIYDGIKLIWDANANVISGNKIKDNGYGVSIVHSGDNTLYHNNFINNGVSCDYANTWDDGYPSGGNYWSDYTGLDSYSGSGQNVTGSDGIGDTLYTIDANNTDRYPLMGPISVFNAGTWDEITYYVDTVSNSTISDFHFSEDDKLVSFNVNGTDGTVGFCRVTIPRDLMWCYTLEEWNVTINGNPPTHLKAMEDADHTYLYFTYNHSIQEVQIEGTHVIPEFPALTSMLLILIVLTVTIATYKRRLLKTRIH